MTRYYCDRCGDEFKSIEDNLYVVQIPIINGWESQNKKYDLCTRCVNYIETIIKQGHASQK